MSLRIATAALLLAGCGAAPSAKTFDAPPNVLLITVDTLRADRLGAYGYAAAQTPVLDRLAREGLLFEDASTVIPRTTQSLGTLFTSRYPHEHGSLEVGTPIDADLPVLAEILRANGYTTAGISPNGAAGRTQGLDRGFDFFADREEISRRYPSRNALSRIQGRATSPMGSAEAVTTLARDWLAAERDPAKPFLLWLLYFDPHWIYDPPAPFDAGVDTRQLVFYRDMLRFTARNATTYFNLNGRSALALPTLSALYDGEVAYTDAMIGQLLDALPDDRETLVLYTSDHGESLGEHGYFYEHGDFVYQATMRVPLVVHAPGVIPAGVRLRSPVSLIDLLPTLLGLIDVAPPEQAALRGRDLSGSVLAGEEDPERATTLLYGESASALVAQNPTRAIGGALAPIPHVRRYIRDGRWAATRLHGSDPVSLYDAAADPLYTRNLAATQPERLARMRVLLDSVSVFGGRWRSARDARFKLIRIPEARTIRYELYDLTEDPHETRDLSTTHPTEAARLRKALDTWLATIPTEVGGLGNDLDEAERRKVEEELRSLGYID